MTQVLYLDANLDNADWPKRTDDHWDANSPPSRIGSKVFCPTGPGGGRDATCSPGKRGGQQTSQQWLDSLSDGEKEAVKLWSYNWEFIRKRQVNPSKPTAVQTVEEFVNRHAEINNTIFVKPGDPALELSPGDPIGQALADRTGLSPDTRILKIRPPQFPKFEPSSKIIYSKIPTEADRQKFAEEQAKIAESKAYEDRISADWDSSLSKAPIHDGVAYRGLLNVDAKAFVVGSSIKMNADSSSSKNEKTGAQFATRTASGGIEPGDEERGFQWKDTGDGILLEIRTKTAADVSAVSAMDKRSEEAEVILRKGTEYRVVEIQDQVGKTEHGSYRKVVLEEI